MKDNFCVSVVLGALIFAAPAHSMETQRDQPLYGER